MPWVRLSDDWYDDEDLVNAGPLALLVFPLLISWSLRNLRDGKVPSGQIRRLVDWSELGADPEQAIAPLVACGRLQVVDGGYLITNFLKYQPSREKVMADREKDRKRKAATRSGDGPSASDEAPAERPRRVRPESTRNPDPPDPVPVPDVSSSSSSSSDLVPEAVWQGVAKKKAQNPKVEVGNFRKWSATVIENDKRDHGEEAAWIWTTYEISESQLIDVIVSGSKQILTTLPKRQDPAA
jgi:hypothetical protein